MAKNQKVREDDKRGAPKGSIGNVPYVPTDEAKERVKALYAYGVPQSAIAQSLGISEDTLQRHFKPELNAGIIETNARIGKRLYEKAMDGDTTALIWWTKARMGWKGTDSHEVAGKDGKPIEVRGLPSVDAWVAGFAGAGQNSSIKTSGEE